MARKNGAYTVIDLFAGCGGLSLGLYQAGWNGVFAIEKNPCAYATLCHNLIEKKHHFKYLLKIRMVIILQYLRLVIKLILSLPKKKRIMKYLYMVMLMVMAL